MKLPRFCFNVAFEEFVLNNLVVPPLIKTALFTREGYNLLTLDEKTDLK